MSKSLNARFRSGVGVIAPACPGPRHIRAGMQSGGGAEKMVKDLNEKVFPARTINFVAVTRDGTKEVRGV